MARKKGNIKLEGAVWVKREARASVALDGDTKPDTVEVDREKYRETERLLGHCYRLLTNRVLRFNKTTPKRFETLAKKWLADYEKFRGK